MNRLLAALALTWIAISGCKKTPTETPVETSAEPGFVYIPMDTDDPDLIGSELMVATAQCGDLVKLEPSAMLGKLKDGEIRCLEDALRSAEKQTAKDKISRVLMADAFAKGDEHRWETIVRRHLNEIDRSDADLCYRFARFLASRGPEHADECMHWADIALENRSQWQGQTHVDRVYALYKVRAVSSQTKWQSLEEQYVREPDNAKLLEDKGRARNDAKTLAREWLEYARSAGKDTSIAEQMCVSAAGTAEFCAPPQ